MRWKPLINLCIYVVGGHNVEIKHNMKHTVMNYQTNVEAKLFPAAVGFGQE